MSLADQKIEQVRALLAKTEIPSSLLLQQLSATTGPTATVDRSLVERYTKARDEYQRRKLMHTILETITTTASFDQNDPEKLVWERPEPPSEVEKRDLEERSRQVLQRLKDKATDLQRKLFEYKNKHADFISRREEFERMVTLHEQQQSNSDNDQDNLAGSMLEQQEEEFDEQAAARSEERLGQLQKRRAELEVKLRTLENENARKIKALDAKKKQVEILAKKPNDSNNIVLEDVTLYLNNPEKFKQLQQKNAELQANLDKNTEIKNYYDNFRLYLEEVSGIRILSVESFNGDYGMENENSAGALKLTVELLKEYRVAIILKVRHRDSVSIERATFVNPESALIVTGPNPDDENLPPVQIRIPPLDDLVKVTNTATTSSFRRPGDNLRFLLRETIARITAIQARVQELTELQNLALTKIGSMHAGPNPDSFGGEDQEVVCSLDHESMTVVLRMTPDCPLIAGSVYIDQLVGLGGWDAKVVQQIQQQVNTMPERSPVQVLRNLQQEIHRRQLEEGLSLPPTPKVPMLRGGSSPQQQQDYDWEKDTYP
jgi:hypothetical protein